MPMIHRFYCPRHDLPASEILVVADYLARDWLVSHAAAATPAFPADGTDPARVWLCDLGVDLTDPTQRRIILALQRDGAIRLVRADLVTDRVRHAASELTSDDGLSTWHYILAAPFEFSREEYEMVPTTVADMWPED